MTIKSNNIFSSKGLKIPGLLILEPNIIGDSRGFFFESWNKQEWLKILRSDSQDEVDFVQDNHSKSSQGVLRGLHYQKSPYTQGKLVRCTSGEIYDIAVDLRKDSSTFCEWAGIYLSSENKKQFWIPEGFAHGFLTISENAEVLYKTTNYWNKDCERSLLWNDESINIKWPNNKIKCEIKLSDKDKRAKSLTEINPEDLF